MKTILVLTDFSENATCAAEAALALSEKLHTDILLFNTYVNYATMASYSGGGWIVDEFSERKNNSKLGLEMLMEGLESLSDKLYPGDWKPGISFQSNDNDLGLDVEEIIHQNNIELIVMGARSGDKSEVAYGADTNAVIQYATRPVFIIPHHTNLQKIRKVIFTTNFDKADLAALHYVAKIGKMLHYQIEVIHISETNETTASELAKEQEFKEQMTRLNYQGLDYHKVNGKDVVNRLSRLIEETGSGLMAMLHHQHSFFVRLFAHSETKKALAKQKIALLVFPSKME